MFVKSPLADKLFEGLLLLFWLAIAGGSLFFLATLPDAVGPWRWVLLSPFFAALVAIFFSLKFFFEKK